MMQSTELKKPMGAFLRYKAQWLRDSTVDDIREIVGDDEEIPLPGDTVKRGTRLAVYLSNIWKEMDYGEKRPWMDETAREKRLYEEALSNGGVTLTLAVDPNTSRAQQFGDAQRFQEQQEQPPSVVIAPADGGTAAFTANVPIAKPTGAVESFGRPTETTKWAGAFSTPARPLNFTERLQAARLVAAWAEREADVIGEQGHQLVEEMEFSQHKLSEARGFRNQVWMGEVFQHNVGELEKMQRSGGVTEDGSRKQMIRQLELAVGVEAAQRDAAATRLAAAVSDSAAAAAKRSAESDLPSSKKPKLGGGAVFNPANSSTSNRSSNGKHGTRLVFVRGDTQNEKDVFRKDQSKRISL
eukprot:gene6871-34667_t